jgi:hypothetical protein
MHFVSFFCFFCIRIKMVFCIHASTEFFRNFSFYRIPSPKSHVLCVFFVGCAAFPPRPGSSDSRRARQRISRLVAQLPHHRCDSVHDQCAAGDSPVAPHPAVLLLRPAYVYKKNRLFSLNSAENRAHYRRKTTSAEIRHVSDRRQLRSDYEFRPSRCCQIRLKFPGKRGRRILLAGVKKRRKFGGNRSIFFSAGIRRSYRTRATLSGFRRRGRNRRPSCCLRRAPHSTRGNRRPAPEWGFIRSQPSRHDFLIAEYYPSERRRRRGGKRGNAAREARSARISPDARLANIFMC